MQVTALHTAEILNADLHPVDVSLAIRHVSIDSRSMHNNEATLFFAIKGPNHDGHQFINDLFGKGVRNFVVEKIPESLSSKANFLVVRNSVDALQEFAAHHRSNFRLPVIGITGSNGKTIVKEWLNFLLSPDYNIIRSPKSYNSQIGVPLSVLGIDHQHNLAIIEAGISQAGEMAKLERIVKPTIGVLTGIGSAHDEGFSSRQEKISEKLLLFNSAEVVICPYNTACSRAFTWSFDNPEADVFLEKSAGQSSTVFRVHFNREDFEVEIPFRDGASLENAATCLAVMCYLKYDAGVIASRMSQLYPMEMRLQVKNGINRTTIIDDSYSSDFQSLKIALDFLESRYSEKKTCILSDIYQSGLTETDLYTQLSELVAASGIERVIGIGQTISKYSHLFRVASMYETTEDFLRAWDESSFSNETILVKGARQFRFERIVTHLEEKTHETVLEINLNAISHNLNYFRSKIRKDTRLMVMVKAFGYGAGSFEIARLLEYHKVDYLGVAFADEGISLKSAGITLPIMVMNPESTSFESIIQNGLEPEIYSIRGLKSFIRLAVEADVTDYPIHLKLDTGMHRLGFEEAHLGEMISLLRATRRISVKSILSHLATSDDVSFRDFTLSQISLFGRLSDRISAELGSEPVRHILNTSGISNFPQAQFDMVRLGIGIYGFSNDDQEQQNLQIVGTLKSVISQIHNIGIGESVGYGRRFIADRPSVIATIPVGYADGIRRNWGNGVGYVTVNGSRAPIVGSVCMDMLMADVTDIHCAEGDQVVVIGEDPSAIDMARALHTIPYEILTGISHRVKRIFYRE